MCQTHSLTRGCLSMTTRSFLLAALLVGYSNLGPHGWSTAVAATRDAATQWPAGKSYALGGLTVEISKPLCVGRSHKEFWYANLARFADGTLAMSIRLGDDIVTEDNARVLWSHDGGLAWSEPKPYSAQSFSYLLLPSGEIALLPHCLYKAPSGCKAPINIINSQGGIRRVEGGVEVTGLPRPTGRDPFSPPDDVATAVKLGRACLDFNGTPLAARDGKYLTIVYGIFSDAKRYSTLVAESTDGLHWRIRSTVADENCKLPGNEGPCEARLCRLADGRLMCVFRRGWETYGQSWSADDGRNWSEPVAMKNEGKVEPKLLVLPSGTVVLAGGRPGLYLWFNRDGTGKNWQAVDTLAHHNALLPGEPISPTDPQNAGGTTSYAGIVALDAHSFLYVYDRVPQSFRVRTGWKANPKQAGDVREMFSVRLTGP